MSLSRNLRKSFSWRLALTFVGLGVAVAVLTQLCQADFDRRGFVEGRDPDRIVLKYYLNCQPHSVIEEDLQAVLGLSPSPSD